MYSGLVNIGLQLAVFRDFFYLSSSCKFAGILISFKEVLHFFTIFYRILVCSPVQSSVFPAQISVFK